MDYWVGDCIYGIPADYTGGSLRIGKGTTIGSILMFTKVSGVWSSVSSSSK
jgi:hypothetical protein